MALQEKARLWEVGRDECSAICLGMHNARSVFSARVAVEHCWKRKVLFGAERVARKIAHAMQSSFFTSFQRTDNPHRMINRTKLMRVGLNPHPRT